MNNALKRFVPRRMRRIYRKYVSPIVRDQYYYEYTARKKFFRRAFALLSFNGIDGDYLEFGCCGGVTFRLAYKYSRKYKHLCKLWAFDSFCGLPPKTLPEDEHPIWMEGTMAIATDEFKKICRESNLPESDYKLLPVIMIRLSLRRISITCQQIFVWRMLTVICTVAREQCWNFSCLD